MTRSTQLGVALGAAILPGAVSTTPKARRPPTPPAPPRSSTLSKGRRAKPPSNPPGVTFVFHDCGLTVPQKLPRPRCRQAWIAMGQLGNLEFQPRTVDRDRPAAVQCVGDSQPEVCVVRDAGGLARRQRVGQRLKLSGQIGRPRGLDNASLHPLHLARPYMPHSCRAALHHSETIPPLKGAQTPKMHT